MVGWYGGRVVGWYGDTVVRRLGGRWLYGGRVVGWWGGRVVGPKDGVRDFRVHSFNEREESA